MCASTAQTNITNEVENEISNNSRGKCRKLKIEPFSPYKKYRIVLWRKVSPAEQHFYLFFSIFFHQFLASSALLVFVYLESFAKSSALQCAYNLFHSFIWSNDH